MYILNTSEIIVSMENYTDISAEKLSVSCAS